MWTQPKSKPVCWLLAGGLAAVMAYGGQQLIGARAVLTSQSALSTRLRLPLAFERNEGQATAPVRYLARTTGATLLIGDREASIYLRPNGGSAPSAHSKAPRAGRRSDGSAAAAGAVVRMSFAGALPAAKATASDKLPGHVNYLLGNDPAQWKQGLPTFARVRGEGIYPGIDVAYYGNGRQLEYDLVVQPAADPAQIKIDVAGADSLQIDERGDLLIETVAGTMRQERPVAYQEVEGERRTIEARYALNDTRLSFELGNYDRTRPLVIDPVINYATFLGGSGNDLGLSVAVDSNGNAYVAGRTESGNFPTTIGPALLGTRDAFVSKINAAGTALVYSTYVGGNSNDTAQGIVVDGAGNATVAGDTASTNFPVTNGSTYRGSGDAFVFRLDPTGSGIFSSYLGGTDSDIGNGVDIDGSGNAYVVGTTSSNNFTGAVNAFGGASDAFVTKIDNAGTTVAYTRYLGGNDFDAGFGLSVEGTGDAVVVGDTFSPNFPTLGPVPGGGARDGVSDGFVSRVNASGSDLSFSTYLGGGDFDSALAVVSGASGIFVTGTTYSTDFTVGSSFQSAIHGSSDAYVVKLTNAGSSIVYSTYLGGEVLESGYSITLDGAGNAWVAGETWSTDFPILDPAQAYFGGGVLDGFVSQVAADGQSLLFSSYLGGEGDDVALGVALSASESVFLTGSTTSTELPVTAGAPQGVPGGLTDGFVIRLGAGAGVPLPPTDLSATASVNAIVLTWDDNSDNEVNFQVERSSGAEAFTQIGTPTAATFSDTDVAPLGSYIYRVRAVNAVGASPYSNHLSVTVPTELPDAPTGLFATLINANRIDLAWNDNSDNEDGFRIERQVDGGAFVLFDLQLPNAEATIDLSVAPGVTYVYRVVAFNVLGDSAPSVSNTIGGYQGGKIKVTPARAKFPKVKAGPVPIGKKKRKTITIQNLARTELRGTIIAPDEPFFVISGGGSFTLAPKKKRKVVIEFAPVEADRYLDILTITSTDPNRAVVNVSLTGMGS